MKNWKRYPLLDFLLSLSPVHSTSENAINVVVSFYRPRNYFPFVALLKYRATLFASFLLLFCNSRFLSLFNMQSIFSSTAFFHLSLSCRHKSCSLFLFLSFRIFGALHTAFDFVNSHSKMFTIDELFFSASLLIFQTFCCNSFVGSKKMCSHDCLPAGVSLILLIFIQSVSLYNKPKYFKRLRTTHEQPISFSVFSSSFFLFSAKIHAF